MNVSEQVIKVLNELSKKLGISIDWTQQNILPQIKDFMHRYALYETYDSILWLVIGVILITLAIILFLLAYKHKDWDDGVITAFIGIGITFLIVGILISIAQIGDIIKVNTIPETYLIDYIQKLIQ